MPGGSLVVDIVGMSESAPDAPFLVDGGALRLSEGCLTGGVTARHEMKVDVPAGTWYGWLHANWDDSCSNSITLELPGQPPRTAGEDAIYRAWHWVPIGPVTLTQPLTSLALVGREDGVAVDQLLFSTARDFLPSGRLAASSGEATTELRRFADDFNRSPGHGLEGWTNVHGDWQIAFSFDPNRIPNQYSLEGQASPDQAALVRIDGSVWRGARLSFNLRPGKGAAGIVLGLGEGQSPVEVLLTTGREGDLRISGGDPIPLNGAFREDQWHHVRIDAWPGFVSVWLDGKTLTNRRQVALTGGGIGLLTAGIAAFDDVQVTEIPYLLDGDGKREIAWRIDEGAEWIRTDDGLIADRGRIHTDSTRGPLGLVMIATDSDLRVLADGQPLPASRNGKWLVAEFPPDTSTFSLEPVKSGVRIETVAVVTPPEAIPDVARIGPYDFSTARLVDPSDYLDFTPEEIEAMNADPEKADVNRRSPRVFPVVGRGESKTAWNIQTPRWQVADGCLTGDRPGATLRHVTPIGTWGSFSGKIRLSTLDSAATVRLYAGDDQALTVRFVSEASPDDPALTCMLRDTQWHAFRITASPGLATVTVDDQPAAQLEWQRGSGDLLELAIDAGRVQFDDLLIENPRHLAGDHLYTFEQREPDWWREGGQWLDHAGIACVIASNWVSLAAPESEGMLWNKRTFKPDLAVAFGIEEYSEWFGWRARPHSHEHHPFDNVRLTLAGTDPAVNYTLEINAENRRYSLLKRNGEVVARRAQDATFPIRYGGGHAPYAPRRNRIQLVKRGGELHAFVNGREILSWTDPEPLTTSRIGIGGHHTHVNFTRIEINELDGGERNR